ncbi:3216_t:CDS:1 [Paraglomus occultum]|uniref:3216_t:CDS:1 n=1 Tax=Paraglomus occultum TaxID=144539 RepID=A0A9N9CSL9_9GLOM|nr:3216_t:CDS:1 [Paraglomus occultum]
MRTWISRRYLYDATDGADQEMDIWKEIVLDDFSSITPNDNEDDVEINIDWSDVPFDDLDESVPNENEEADITFDDSDENEEANDSMDIDSPLMLDEGDINNNKKRRLAILTPCVLLVKDKKK